MADVILTYTIPIGTKLRIGHRITGSVGNFTYLNVNPTSEDSPYTFTLAAGLYDLELTTVCPNCSGNNFSDPFIQAINVPA